MPTVALLNGHSFAGGFMTAMMHDYRVQNPHRGFLCLNELQFGAPLRPPMASIFRQKVLRPDTYRAMVLESKKFNALEAFKEGIVDCLGGWEETLAFVQEMQLTGKAESGIYGKMKEEMWRETISYLDAGAVELEDIRARDRIRDGRREEAIRAIAAWEEATTSNGTSKL